MQPFNTSSMYPFSSQNLCYILIIRILHTMKPIFFISPNIVLKSDWLGIETGPDLRKNKGSHNPIWPGRLTRQISIKNLVVTRWLFFCFLSKRRPFNFLKIRVDPGDQVKTWWLQQNLWPRPWARSIIGPGFKTMLLRTCLLCLYRNL